MGALVACVRWHGLSSIGFRGMFQWVLVGAHGREAGRGDCEPAGRSVCPRLVTGEEVRVTEQVEVSDGGESDRAGRQCWKTEGRDLQGRVSGEAPRPQDQQLGLHLGRN